MNVGVASLKMCYPPGIEYDSNLMARSVTSLTFDQGACHYSHFGFQ